MAQSRAARRSSESLPWLILGASGGRGDSCAAVGTAVALLSGVCLALNSSIIGFMLEIMVGSFAISSGFDKSEEKRSEEPAPPAAAVLAVCGGVESLTAEPDTLFIISER